MLTLILDLLFLVAVLWTIKLAFQAIRWAFRKVFGMPSDLAVAAYKE